MVFKPERRIKEVYLDNINMTYRKFQDGLSANPIFTFFINDYEEDYGNPPKLSRSSTENI